MKEIVKVKEKYSLTLENYWRNNSTLNYKIGSKFCHLCGGSVRTIEIKKHLDSHEILPQENLHYQLTLPFRTVNNRIKRGIPFVKLLCLINGKGISVPYNGLFLKNFSQVTDTNDITVRWDAKGKRFYRSMW